MSNITQTVSKEKTMATMNKGIHAAGLSGVLSGKGPFTLFAPSELAFEKLQGETIQDLLSPENKAKLTELLNRHVVLGKLNFKDLKDGDSLQTLSGKQLQVKVLNTGRVSIDGATVQNRDMQTSNGVIHSLDTVLKN